MQVSSPPALWPILLCLLTGPVLAGEKKKKKGPPPPLWRIPQCITREVFHPDSSRDSSTCPTSSSFLFYNFPCSFEFDFFIIIHQKQYSHLFPIYCQLAVNCGLCLETISGLSWTQLGLSIGVDTTTRTIPSLLQHSFFTRKYLI